MCCLLVVWKSLVDYLRSTPIVRYEQVPFDIDDHVGEEFEQEDTPFLPQPSNNTENVEEKNENETKIMDQSECTSPTSLRSYITAESTSEEDINEVAC